MRFKIFFLMHVCAALLPATSGRVTTIEGVTSDVEKEEDDYRNKRQEPGNGTGANDTTGATPECLTCMEEISNTFKDPANFDHEVVCEQIEECETTCAANEKLKQTFETGKKALGCGSECASCIMEAGAKYSLGGDEKDEACEEVKECAVPCKAGDDSWMTLAQRGEAMNMTQRLCSDGGSQAADADVAKASCLWVMTAALAAMLFII